METLPAGWFSSTMGSPWHMSGGGKCWCYEGHKFENPPVAPWVKP